VAKSSSKPEKGTPSKGSRRLRFLTAGIVLIGLCVYAWYQLIPEGAQQAGCTVAAAGTTVLLEPQQAANASTIAAVAASRNLPQQAVAIALATAMQESGLANLDHGDLDSRGLFQQRPSQGWGTAAQIMDPVYASNAFYNALVKIPHYSRLPITVAAQDVQRSNFPQAYAKQASDATLLASVLTGHRAAALTCTTGSTSKALIGGNPATIRAQLIHQFGAQVAPQTAATGAAGGMATPPGTKAVTLAVSSAPAGSGTGTAARAAQQQRGWQLAQWAVANASGLKVWKVSFGDFQWSAGNSNKGWVKSAAQQPGGTVRITVAQ
jgi:hypothetical protein